MVFLSHFAYICISTFASHWHAKPPLFDIHGFAEQWDILIKFCVLIYFNIVKPPWYMENSGESLPRIILVNQVIY